MEKIKGSYKDPKGYVYKKKGKLYRKVTQYGFDNYIAAKNSGIFRKLTRKNNLVNFKEVNVSNKRKEIELNIEEIPYISYPYEWSFNQVKDAAIFHIKFHLELLENNFTLSDATPFNIQFIGSKPIFIDHLSIEKYEEFKPWMAYNQFCENFLFPLVLSSYNKVDINFFMGKNLNGVSLNNTFKLLPFKRKILPSIFIHVVLPYLFSKYFVKKNKLEKKINPKGPSKKNFIGLLNQLSNFITNINHNHAHTTWQDYQKNNFYSKSELLHKKIIIGDYIKRKKPKLLFDIGCNNACYSLIAIKNGANYVVGFDNDIGALQKAYEQSKKLNRKFLPLFFDNVNPSPNLGWDQHERDGFNERASKCSHLIALAISHHIIISNNVPIHDFIKWLTKISKNGIVEFIPREDDAVKKLLQYRDDIFHEYSLDNFLNNLKKYVNLKKITIISKSGRVLIEYGN